MAVEVRLSEVQQKLLLGHGPEAAARLVQELLKFCLYEHNQIPRRKLMRILGKFGEAPQTEGPQRFVFQFIFGIDKVFDTVTAANIASLGSEVAVVLLGPSLARPSVVYHFTYRALTRDLQAQPAKQTGIGHNGQKETNNDRGAHVQSEPAQLHLEIEDQPDSLNLMEDPSNQDLIDKTIDNVAKKLVRALVVNASSSNIANKTQGPQKVHTLLLGSCMPDPPTGLLPKRVVALDHKRVQLVNVVLIDSGSESSDMATDRSAASEDNCEHIWYQCGDAVKGLRIVGNH